MQVMMSVLHGWKLSKYNIAWSWGNESAIKSFTAYFHLRVKYDKGEGLWNFFDKQNKRYVILTNTAIIFP